MCYDLTVTDAVSTVTGRGRIEKNRIPVMVIFVYIKMLHIDRIKWPT